MGNAIKNKGEAQFDVRQNEIIIRLERYQKDLEHLKKQLNSHSCEPKTHDHFKMMEVLKEELECLNKINDEIIVLIKDCNTTTDDCLEGIKNQLEAFNKIQAGISKYKEISSCY